MKKLLILLAFIGILNVSYAQVDSTKYVTNSDTEKLIDKYTDKVSEVITNLAQQLKQPAEHVYKLLIKQQVIKAKLGLYLGVSSFLLFLFLGLIFCLKADWNGKDTVFTIGGPISLVIALIILMVILCNVGDIVTGLFNPEYGAIQEIIEFIK